MNRDLIWAEFLPAVSKSPCDCASGWVWVPGEALLALERLCAHLWRGWIDAGGWDSQLQTDWRHQQNRGHAWSTTQNKPGQTTGSSSSGCWARLLAEAESAAQEHTHTHTPDTCFYTQPWCVLVLSYKSKAAWRQGGREHRESDKERKECEFEKNERTGQAEVLTLSSSHVASLVTVIAQITAASEVADKRSSIISDLSSHTDFSNVPPWPPGCVKRVTAGKIEMRQMFKVSLPRQSSPSAA